ncbi:MAG: rhodanese-like domain-containing protein [Saprospiraceae bacterium]
MESTTYLLIDENGKDVAIFTGDALFLGDVGRPDLAIKQGELTREDLAGFLFDSLRNRIMPLGDDIIVYPNHGAGSACGKKMSKETWGYLGDQKKTNYALRADMTREEFIKEVTDGLVEPPQYFPKNAVMNKMGYDSIDTVRERGSQALSVRAFKAAWEGEEALVIDTRSKDEFVAGFIPGSIFIGVDGSFATWVGTLITDLKQPILFVAEPGKEEEVITRLARVGYDYPIGYLEGGFEAWKAAGEDVDTIPQLTPAMMEAQFDGKNLQVLDVRKESEYKAEHLVGVTNFPLDFINRNMSKLDQNGTYHLYCASGYRSVVAASILKARGYDNMVNIPGGMKELLETKLPRTEYVCQNTEL